MAIDLFVDDIESVDESLREEYVKGEDGRFVLKSLGDTLSGYVKVDDIESHEKTQGLKSALDKERDARRDAERKAKQLEDQQASMSEEEKAELAQLRKAKDDAEEARRRKEGEFDKWRDEIATKHADETKGLVEERDQLKNYVVKTRVAADIAEACNEFGGRANILEPLVRQAVSAEFAEGDVAISVMEGGTRLLDDEGKPLSIRGFVERMSKDKEYGDLFASKQKSGGGSSGDGGNQDGDTGSGGETPPEGLKRSEMSKSEKAAFISEHGSEEYFKIPA